MSKKPMTKKQRQQLEAASCIDKEVHFKDKGGLTERKWEPSWTKFTLSFLTTNISSNKSSQKLHIGTDRGLVTVRATTHGMPKEKTLNSDNILSF